MLPTRSSEGSDALWGLAQRIEEHEQRKILGRRNQLEAVAANMGKCAPRFVDPET
jgi:hypothetical protein